MTMLPHLIDAVIAITLIECVVLSVHHRLTGRGIAPADFIVNLFSGLCLMLALRGALTAAAAVWVLLPLMLAGMTHALDLSRRWRTKQ